MTHLISSEEAFLPIFSTNSEAAASELVENLEEMFPRYYMDSDVIIRFKYSNMLPVAKGLREYF